MISVHLYKTVYTYSICGVTGVMGLVEILAIIYTYIERV